MIQHSPQTASRPGIASRLVRRWVLAAFIGLLLGVTIALKGAIGRDHSFWWAMTAVSLGWIAFLALAPWTDLRQLRSRSSDLRRLTRRLRDVTGDRRERPLRDLVLDRDDELGDLSRAVHDALAHAVAARLEARRLHRDIDHTVRRETDRATQTLHQQARTDPLTGLGNRRTLEERMTELLRSDRRGRRTIVAMVLDLDRFKAVNDELGHDVGDEVLSDLGRLLRENLRQEDCAVRLGGDEFVVIMPGLSLRAAKSIAKRLAGRFDRMPWSHARPRPTISIGLASAYADQLADASELLRQADRALYASKRAGRACVTLAADLPDAA
ncbi:MAG: GGDEF domain-containing protein [Planctomycetota bacterium]|jgi:diguanylate cyclase (GGDEF)-like protein